MSDCWAFQHVERSASCARHTGRLHGIGSADACGVALRGALQKPVRTEIAGVISIVNSTSVFGRNHFERLDGTCLFEIEFHGFGSPSGGCSYFGCEIAARAPVLVDRGAVSVGELEEHPAAQRTDRVLLDHSGARVELGSCRCGNIRDARTARRSRRLGRCLRNAPCQA